jgi:hypothetical protein
MLIVSLLLPALGSTAASMAPEPCPMLSQEQGLHGAADMPCCADMADASSGKSPCKPGLDCKTGGLVHIAVDKSLLPLSSLHPTVYEQALVQRERIPLWRPPRAC